MKAKIYVRWLGAGIAFAATLYASYVGITWCRYGRAKLSSDPKDQDSRLDELMPVYQVVERRRVCVAAPVETTFAAACDMNLQDSVIVHAIFRTRELLLGSQREKKVYPYALWTKPRLGAGECWLTTPDAKSSSARQLSHGSPTQCFGLFRGTSLSIFKNPVMSRSRGHYAPILTTPRDQWHARRPASPRLIQMLVRNSGGIGLYYRLASY